MRISGSTWGFLVAFVVIILGILFIPKLLKKAEPIVQQTVENAIVADTVALLEIDFFTFNKAKTFEVTIPKRVVSSRGVDGKVFFVSEVEKTIASETPETLTYDQKQTVYVVSAKQAKITVSDVTNDGAKLVEKKGRTTKTATLKTIK